MSIVVCGGGAAGSEEPHALRHADERQRHAEEQGFLRLRACSRALNALHALLARQRGAVEAQPHTRGRPLLFSSLPAAWRVQERQRLARARSPAGVTPITASRVIFHCQSRDPRLISGFAPYFIFFFFLFCPGRGARARARAARDREGRADRPRAELPLRELEGRAQERDGAAVPIAGGVLNARGVREGIHSRHDRG